MLISYWNIRIWNITLLSEILNTLTEKFAIIDQAIKK